MLRTAFKAKALVPFSRPGSSALTAGGAPHARLCEHCFSRTLVWQSSALDIRGYNLSGTKARASWHKHFVWYSALGIKDFSAAVLESGLRQGDSKCSGSLSTCPSYSPGNRHALLAHRPEETWPAQRHGIFVLFVCCPWRTQHWGPLRFAKSLLGTQGWVLSTLFISRPRIFSRNQLYLGWDHHSASMSLKPQFLSWHCQWNHIVNEYVIDYDLLLYQCGRILLIFSWCV